MLQSTTTLPFPTSPPAGDPIPTRRELPQLLRSVPPQTTPLPPLSYEQFCAQLKTQLREVLHTINDFRAEDPTPQRADQFERKLYDQLREVGRVATQIQYNAHEVRTPDQLPSCIRHGDQEYRRPSEKTPQKIGTLFGTITLKRFLFQALEKGQPGIAPLAVRLGVVAGLATPAIAELTGQWAADFEQRKVRGLLGQWHGVYWSTSSYRNVLDGLCAGLAPHREQAQIDRVTKLLKEAFASNGPHQPTLVVGRDGIMLPMRRQAHRPADTKSPGKTAAKPKAPARGKAAKPKATGRGKSSPTGATGRSSAQPARTKPAPTESGKEYKEGATGTVSVYGRNGRRLGTVYLGQMPEPHQVTLTSDLTSLVTAILKGCDRKRCPLSCLQLVYVTDGGYQPRRYFETVLRRMVNPHQPENRLPWRWVLDFYHASSYVAKMARCLFGEGKNATKWTQRMCHWLKHRVQGVSQVLRSATQLENGRSMSKQAAKEYGEAYRYLRRHRRYMDYQGYQRQGVPIGSGVTEAACKTVFATRLKRSGMTWQKEGGQRIVDLRVLVLSEVWEGVWKTYLSKQQLPTALSYGPVKKRKTKKAA